MCTLFLVAVVTDLGLGLQAQHRVIRFMPVVAVNTGKAFYIVDAAWPVEPGIVVVTAKADFILYIYRGLIIERYRR